jgi:hypothetical protein
MNLLQLKQVIDKALEEQPEFGEKEVFYASTYLQDLSALRLGFVTGKVMLISADMLDALSNDAEEKVWIP